VHLIEAVAAAPRGKHGRIRKRFKGRFKALLLNPLPLANGLWSTARTADPSVPPDPACIRGEAPLADLSDYAIGSAEEQLKIAQLFQGSPLALLHLAPPYEQHRSLKIGNGQVAQS
jgi:hypothetical protein